MLSPVLRAGAAASAASAQCGWALSPPPVLAGASLGVMGGLERICWIQPCSSPRGAAGGRVRGGGWARGGRRGEAGSCQEGAGAARG